MQDAYTLTKYRGKYCAYRRVDGQPERRSLGTNDLTLARKRFNEFLKRLEQQQRDAGYTVKQLWSLRQSSMEGRRMAVSMSFSGKAVIPFFGHLLPGAITEQNCKDYMSKRRKLGRKDGTILTELSHLRDTLTWAKKQKLIDDVPYIVRPSRPPPKTDFLTKDDFRVFLSYCSTPHVRLFSVLAVATGSRATALLELTWDRVDLIRRRIELRTSEMTNKKGRATIPINDSAFQELTKAKEVAKSEYVIEYHGERVASVKKSIKAAAAKASLSTVSPHVFRHSAAVWMAEGGVPMEEISQYLGHTNPEVTRRVYARFSPDYLAKAAKALEV